jgi:hypothetical protein
MQEGGAGCIHSVGVGTIAIGNFSDQAVIGRVAHAESVDSTHWPPMKLRVRIKSLRVRISDMEFPIRWRKARVGGPVKGQSGDFMSLSFAVSFCSPHSPRGNR